MEKFDLVIIGAGPAGYAAAMRALDFGKKVALIEKNKVGGAGVYDGALSSKAMWSLSRQFDEFEQNLGNHTFNSKNPNEVTWETIQRQVNEAIFERKLQYSCHLKLLNEAEIAGNITYLRGTGKFVGPHEIEVTRKKGSEIIYGDYILIATGSKPRSLPNIDVDEKVILTSNGIQHIPDFPKSMVIVGAGVIGCEYATMFANFGKTKVHIIDRAERILPFEDEDVSGLISNGLEEKGVVIHHTAKLERLEKVEGGVEYELSYPDGQSEVIKVEKALLSIGRVPIVHGLGLEEAGVKLSANGAHIGDNDTQTNVPHIFTAGDVSGHISLVNVGELEGRHAVERMFGEVSKPLSYDNLSSIMFLNPEVAAVGLNEQQCIESNIACKVVKIDYSLIPRAIAMRKTEGFFKIITTYDKGMKILGMRAVGVHASSAIQAVAMLISMNRGIEELAELVHPHPSIIEGIQECVRMLLNKSIFKATVYKDKLQCYGIVNGEKITLERL